MEGKGGGSTPLGVQKVAEETGHPRWIQVPHSTFWPQTSPRWVPYRASVFSAVKGKEALALGTLVMTADLA